jgi:O-antigen/teichoic acid export membrane protein
MRLFAAAVFIITVDVVIAPVFAARGKPQLNVRFDLIGAITFPVVLITGTRFGLNGVCIGWIIAYCFLFLIRIHFVLIELHLSLGRYLKNLYEPLFASLIMAVPLVLLLHNFSDMQPYLRLAVLIFTGILFYGLLLYFITSKDTRSDMKVVLETLFKRGVPEKV